MAKLDISYGVMADPISQQLKEQGYNLDEKSLNYFDRIKEGLNTLMFITTDSMYRQLVQRANKYIVGKVQKWYNEQSCEVSNV